MWYVEASIASTLVAAALMEKYSNLALQVFIHEFVVSLQRLAEIFSQQADTAFSIPCQKLSVEPGALIQHSA